MSTPPPPGQPMPAKGTNGLATAGFVLGLLALLGAWIPVLNFLGIILGVVGAILAGVGLAKSQRVAAGKGLAIAGLIMSLLGILIAIVINVAFVGAVDSAVDDVTDTTVETPSDASADASDADKKPKTDKKLGTSRSNPAPLGSKISGGDWTVKVNSVKTVDRDSIDQTAADGSVLLQISMTATYNGDDEQGGTAWVRVEFVAADGTTYDSMDGSSIFLPENNFDSLRTVYNGASVKGDELLEIPEKNWRNGVLAVSPGLLKDATFLSLK